MTFEIVRPEPRWLEAYLETCRLTRGHLHDDYLVHDPAEFPRWKDRIFTDYRNQEAGIGLRPGIVPSVTFWLIGPGDEKKDECLGVLNIRRVLNEKLRRYGGNVGIAVRPDRRGRGIATELLRRLPGLFERLKIQDDILLTCFENNIPSRRMLERIEGARLEREIVVIEGKPVPILRFVIHHSGSSERKES